MLAWAWYLLFLKQAVDDVKAFFEQNEDAQFLVKVMPVGGKAVAKAIEYVKGTKTKAAMLISVEGGKVSHSCVVPKVCPQFFAICFGLSLS